MNKEYYTKEDRRKIKKEIIKILKEWEWKSEYSTYSEVAEYILTDVFH